MKKISIMLCFILAFVALFAFSTFAYENADITDEADLSMASGGSLCKPEYIVDGDYNKGASCGNSASWVDYYFEFDVPQYITKVIVVNNSIGENVGVKEFTSISEYSGQIYCRMWNDKGEKVYELVTAECQTVYDGETPIYSYIAFATDKVYEDIVKINIATVHNSNAEACIWEVEIYKFFCTEDSEHVYADATCSKPATCIHCDAKTGEKSEEHTGTWSVATCGTPSTCSDCGATEGEVASEHTGTWSEATCLPSTCSDCGATQGEAATDHTWKNASYTAPATCKICGITKGDVWVDSDLPSFIRGPEGDTITYEDIVGEVTLTEGSINGDAGSNIPGGTKPMLPEEVLDGSLAADSYWGGPTNSAIKITLKNEWEITDAQIILFANWASLKVSFYAVDGSLLGESNLGGLQSNYDYFNGKAQENPSYTSFNAALTNVTYGDNDKAVKYIIITNAGAKWDWVPGVVEVYFSGRERIPSECTNHKFEATYPVEPTCTTVGTKVNVCTICGAEEAPVVAPALGHAMGEYTVKVPANCDTAAVLEFACTRCGETVERPTSIQDVTDYADIETAGADGAGGWTTSHKALFDNNKDSYLHASGGWFVESWIELDMPYYITSVTVWTGSWGDNNSWEANFTFYYQAPGSDEWVTVSPSKDAGVIKANTKYAHTLELAEPVYADAIKIKVDRLASFQGQAFEAEVAGTLFADPQLFPKGHTWEETGDVPSACYAGYTLSTCTTCGATKQDEFTKAVGHVWADATCLAPKTCTVCAATEGDVGAHLYDNANDATCNREGCDYVRGVARIGDKYFATLADAFNEAVEGNEIVVLDKIVVEGEATWNLTGKTITFVNSPADNYAVVVKGNLTIVDGTFNVQALFGFGVTGTLTVDGGTFVAETADYLIGSWGTTTINDGSFKANYNCVNAFAGSVVINGGNFEVIDVDNAEWPAQDVFGEGEGTAVIYGGTFSTDIYAYLAETYHIDLDENGKYVAAPTIHVDAKAATCTTNGNVEYWYCETCELVWVDKALTRISNFKSVVTPAAHAESVIQVVTKPTCTDPGEQENICSVCGEVVSTETIAPVAHTVAHVDAEEATCETEGNIEYWYCTVCGAAWTDESCTKVTNLKSVITPAAHTVEYVAAKEATCFEQGNVQYWYCTSCNIVWADEAQMQVTNFKNVIIPITHNVEHVAAKAATCTENGNIEYWYCLDCGYAWLDEACTLNTNLKAVVLPMAEHDYWQLDWSADMKQPTCIEEGYETYKCDCGATKVFYYEPDTVDGHDWVINQETFVKATCIADGYRERKCSLCNAEEAGALDKDIYGDHIYVTDEKPATCQEDGYTKTTCELCDYLNIEPIPANDWSHDYNYSANGIFKECAICGDWGLRDTIKGGNEEAVADYSIYFMGSDVINIYYTEAYSVLDEYYNYTIAKNEDGTYTLTIAECYNGNDTFKLANTTAKFEIVENGGILTFTNADGAVYTFDNIPEEEPITLNYETYAYYDPMDPTGQTINFKVTFVGGYAYILVNTMFEGLPEKFWIEYNPDFGMINTEIGMFFSISNNTLYLPRETELTSVDFEMPEIEEPEVNYGEIIGEIEVEITDNYTWVDLYEYTANKAGQYSFYVPAGFGLWNKAGAEDTSWPPVSAPEIDYYANESGFYVVVNLAENEPFSFYVANVEKGASATIDVYYFTEHTHTEVEIPAVLPTPSTIGYTAGIKCSECGETIKAPVEIKITQTDIVDQFRIDAISLEAKENIAVNYKTYAKAGYNNPYIVFVFNGNEYMMLEPTKIDGDGRLVFKFDQTFPQLMQDNIEAYFYAETAVGEYAMDSVQEYSVLTYILKQLKKNDAALTTVMSDILYMGAKTQIFMNYKTDALVTDLAVAQGYTLTPTAFTEIPSSANITKVTGDRTTGTDWYSTSLAMGASTEAILKFQTDDASNLKIKIAFEGKIYTYNASELKTEVTEDGLVYLIYFDQVKSFEYDKVITATFERDGEQVGSTITYSINSFLARNYNKSSQPANAKELMKALYTYGVSSAAYFG